MKKEIIILKKKINGTYSETKNMDSIERKIKGLEKELNRRKVVKIKKQLNNEEIKAVKDIPKIERELKELKNFMKTARSSRGESAGR